MQDGIYPMTENKVWSKLPCGIGSSLVKVEFSESEGYYIKPHVFTADDLSQYGETLFPSIKDAHNKIRELRKEEKKNAD